MIVFTGDISGKCKKDIILPLMRLFWVVGLLVTIPFLVIFIIAVKESQAYLLAVLGLILGVFCFSMMPVYEAKRGSYLPNKVTINTKLSTILVEGKKFRSEIWIRDVVVVWDRGEWYQIYSPKSDGAFACQKSLISQGTLIDFEKLFKNKLVTSKKEFREMIAKHRS